MKKTLLAITVLTLLSFCIAGAASASVTVAAESAFIGETYASFELIPTDAALLQQPAQSGDEHLPYAVVKAAETKLTAGLKNPDGYDNGSVVAGWGPYQQNIGQGENGTSSLKDYNDIPDIEYLLVSVDESVDRVVDPYKDKAFVYCAYQSGDEYIQIASAKLTDIMSKDKNDDSKTYLKIGDYITSADWLRGVNPTDENAGMRVFLVRGFDSSDASGDTGGTSGDTGGSGSGSGSSSGGCSAGLAGLALLAVPFVVRRKK